VPALEWNFSDIKSLSRLPDFFSCDLVARVNYVGREEREERNDKRDEENGVKQLFSYRWIHVEDESGSIAVKLFGNSQDDLLRSIAVGQKIVFTNLSLRSLMENSRRRLLFLTSTPKTQLYFNLEALQQVLQDEHVGKLIEWDAEPGVSKYGSFSSLLFFFFFLADFFSKIRCLASSSAIRRFAFSPRINPTQLRSTSRESVVFTRFAECFLAASFAQPSINFDSCSDEQ
jgi:hypothetical protein